ncbi:uncharacterized protein [Leptinotarsa decemlineata]|uniref:uncharacterized protein n=1 Tax=Leptinotarsa decemlineata TaxID=7539 RepID=UPI003D30B555
MATIIKLLILAAYIILTSSLGFKGYTSIWEPTNGTCKVDSYLVLKSMKSDKFVNGKDTINLVWGRNFALYRTWVVEAGIGWFVFRNVKNGKGRKLMSIKGGCKKAKPGTKLILRYEDETQEDNKFVFNSDGTIQSLCGKELYLQVENGHIVLADIGEPSASKKDIRFLMEPL